MLVPSQPGVCGEVDERAGGEAGARPPGARALVGFRHELEGERGQEKPAAKGRRERRNALGEGNTDGDEGADDQAPADGHAPRRRLREGVHARLRRSS
jgi:hypothetical protein